jgi:GcrA cell cycle regulator
MGSWTADHDEALRACIADGMSFSETATALNARFGLSLTRNSCIGRAGRHGWKSQLLRSDGANRRKRKEREKIIVLKPKPEPKAPPPPTARAEIIALRCVVVEPQHLLVTDLEDGQCRYPFGEGPFTFCGHAQKDGSSYCRPHAALTVNPDFYRGRRPSEAAE